MFDPRMQHRLARAQHRAYRRQMRGYYRSRGFYGGIGGFTWLLVLGIILMSHQWFWFPLLMFGIPFFFFVLRPRLFGPGNTTYQPPYGQATPYQQPTPYQQEMGEPAQPQQQEAYQPYTQGYRAPAQAVPQTPSPREKEEGYRYAEPANQQQYEEPLTMYPQE